jgi:hypothetical protein
MPIGTLSTVVGAGTALAGAGTGIARAAGGGASRREQARANRASERLKARELDLAEMMQKQRFGVVEDERDWKRQFRIAMSGGTGGTSII